MIIITATTIMIIIIMIIIINSLFQPVDFLAGLTL